jgi:hypothetical protein
MIRILGGLAAGVALAAATVVAASPASAAPGCDGSYFLCVYQYQSYGGAQLFTSQSNNNWDWIGNPYAFRFMNDKMSSVVNTTGRTYAIVAQHDNLDGYQYCVPPGAYRPTVNSDIDNKSSSHQFVSSC